MNSLNSKITNLMVLNGISNETELARCLNVSQSTLHRLLTGKTHKPNQITIKKIADFFDVSVDHLLIDNPTENIYISETERYHDSASSVLRYLMQDIGNISEGELSRRTGVPQPTIHRILSGMTPNPRIESIRPLAEFFNISPDQMHGRVPLPKDHISGSFVTTAATRKIVPLLDWKEIAYWPDVINKQTFKVGRRWITSESGIEGSAFAVKITSDDYLPDFRENTTIIVDCGRQAKEGDFVLGLRQADIITVLGQFVLENSHEVFLDLANTEQELLVGKEILICGVIAEAKHEF